jgi:hypothetical protein
VPNVIYSGDAQAGDGGRVFLDGEEITDRCRAVQVFDDGTLIAYCYKTMNGAFVLRDGDVVMEELRGKGRVEPLPPGRPS